MSSWKWWNLPIMGHYVHDLVVSDFAEVNKIGFIRKYWPITDFPK